MARSILLTGAHLKVFLNNKLYKEVQSISYSLDYGINEIFGIDSPYPQELAPGRTTVSGTIQGIRIRYSGGIQGYDARPGILDALAAPYISVRIQDRTTGEDILFVPNAMIVNQSAQAGAKSTYKISFSFKGLIGFEPLDRA